MTTRRIPARFALLALVVLTLAASLAAHAVVGVAPKPTDDEASVAWRINHERYLRKIHTMTVNPRVSEKARAHSCDMADQQRLFHDPSMGAMIEEKWKIAGENVGQSWDLYDMHVQWMDSPEHRDNILDWRFDKMGVGVCKDSGGTYWATVVFYG